MSIVAHPLARSPLMLATWPSTSRLYPASVRWLTSPRGCEQRSTESRLQELLNTEPKLQREVYQSRAPAQELFRNQSVIQSGPSRLRNGQRSVKRREEIVQTDVEGRSMGQIQRGITLIATLMEGAPMNPTTLKFARTATVNFILRSEAWLS